VTKVAARSKTGAVTAERLHPLPDCASTGNHVKTIEKSARIGPMTAAHAFMSKNYNMGRGPDRSADGAARACATPLAGDFDAAPHTQFAP
jgi:hypothetical protein